MWVKEGIRSKLDLFGLRVFFVPFHDLLHFAWMPKATGRNSKKNAPTTSTNRSTAARHLPGYKWCWCHRFNVSCGLIRCLRMCQHHAVKGSMIREGKYDK